MKVGPGRAELAALGVQGWLEDQLSRPARDPDLTARLGAFKLRISYEAEDDGNGFAWGGLDEMRNLTTLDADPASLLPLLDWENPISYIERSRPADEVIAASLTRAVHAPAQLREVMTQFWHDHFNVHAQKDEFVAVFFPSYDATLRENALGNFRALLGIVAKSPSMLIYLNNAESAASPANENFGRELLELHTLGAGHYLNAHYNRHRHRLLCRGQCRLQPVRRVAAVMNTVAVLTFVNGLLGRTEPLHQDRCRLGADLDRSPHLRRRRHLLVMMDQNGRTPLQRSCRTDLAMKNANRRGRYVIIRDGTARQKN